jgi:sulfur carrier protein ThiS adenylyltransferase
MRISSEEMEALLVSRNTPDVYEKVKKAKVGIAGLGGLGSHVAIALARTGVGNLHLVDFDVVEPSNLNRQEYRMQHIGMNKTEALARQLKEINPYVNITIDTIKVTNENAAKIFQKEEIVCEAFDLPEQKAMLINSLLQKRNDIRIVSGSGMAGYASSNMISTKRVMKRLYLCGDQVNGLRPGWGLMAPRVSICAGHEANMVLRLILGEEEV